MKYLVWGLVSQSKEIYILEFRDPQYNDSMYMCGAHRPHISGRQPFYSTPRHIIKFQKGKEDIKSFQRRKPVTVKETRIGIDWSSHWQHWVLPSKF